jgi:hypothetical protein
MNGGTVTSELVLPAAPSGARLVGTGDYDGNGSADLLWETASTGVLTLWRMAGGTVSATSVTRSHERPARRGMARGR